MRKFLFTAFLLGAIPIAITYFNASTVFGQDTKSAKVEPSSAKTAVTSQADGWRTIQFETTQVTAPDVVVTPDGEWLIFTMLGKLFRLSVKGGEAEQLTFGPYFDANPAISPDGKRVVFDSDRDGSAGNIFLLDLTTREMKQITREDWADRPKWSPDGQAILYLRLNRNDWKPREVMMRPPAEVRKVSIDGSGIETARPQGNIASVFFLPDGRLAWTIVEGAVSPLQGASTVKTRIESLEPGGSVAVARSFDYFVDQVQTNVKTDGIYVRAQKGDFVHELTWLPNSGTDRRITALSGESNSFAVTADNTAAFVGNRGHLWKVMLAGGRMDALPFKAKVRLEIRSRPPTPKWDPVDPQDTRPPRTIRQPRLTPDGTKVLFVALRDLWEQSLSGAPARRITNTSEWPVPFAISPTVRRSRLPNGAMGKVAFR